MNVIDARSVVTNPGGWAPLGKVIGIAIHHTVTTISPLASEDEEIAHIKAIDSYHVRQGWYGIGYHYLVFPSGRLYHVGDGARAHVANRNHELVGIAFVGDLSERLPSALEIAVAGAAVGLVWNRFGAGLEVRGHKQWVVDPAWATSCPGRGIEVLPKIIEHAKGGSQMDIQKLEARIGELQERVARLERLLFLHGGGLEVRVNDENEAVVRGLGAQVKDGKAMLVGDQIGRYLDAMGNNMWLGLAALQERVQAIESAGSGVLPTGTYSVSVSGGSLTITKVEGG